MNAPAPPLPISDAAWSALPGSQQLFLACPYYEALLSGTRGGGKTDALLMDFAQHVGRGFGRYWRGVLFRTQARDLLDVIDKALSFFPAIFPGARFYGGSKMSFEFPTGEVLLFRHIARPSDYQAYHGHAYPWLGFEELTNWKDDKLYRLMMSCCRSTKHGMPRKLRATTNPYGVGHNWVKMRFQLPEHANRVIKSGRLPRICILSYLAENKPLLAADPDYVVRIAEAARNNAEREAWLLGSWDIVSGGMFDDVWDRQVHLVEPFPIPAGWRIFRAFDWGSSKPFSVGWWAVSDGIPIKLQGGKELHTIEGDLFHIHEWYGWVQNQPNVGLRMLATDIAEGIVRRELKWGIRDKVEAGPADSAIFDDTNGNCVAFDLEDAVVIEGETHIPAATFLHADKGPGSRVHGWEQIRLRLKHARRGRRGEPREKPGLFVFKRRCPQWERTVPTLSRDEDKPDDVDTDDEDHCGDMTRYAVRGSVEGTSGVW